MHPYYNIRVFRGINRYWFVQLDLCGRETVEEYVFRSWKATRSVLILLASLTGETHYVFETEKPIA